MAAHQALALRSVVVLAAALMAAHAVSAQPRCTYTTQFSQSLSGEGPETIDLTFEVGQDFTTNGKADIKVTAAINPTSLSSYPNGVIGGSEDLLGTLFTLNGNATALYDIIIPGTRSVYPASPKPVETDSAWNKMVKEGAVTGDLLGIEGLKGGQMLGNYDAGVKWGDKGKDLVQIASFVITSTTGANLDPAAALSNTDWAFRLQQTNGGEGSNKIGGEIGVVPNCTLPTCLNANRPTATCASSTIAVSCTSGSTVTLSQVVAGLGSGCLPQGSAVTFTSGGSTFGPSNTFTCSTAGTTISASVVKPDGSCYPLTLTFSAPSGPTPKCANIGPTSACATSSPYSPPTSCTPGSVVSLESFPLVLDPACTQLPNLAYAVFNATTGAALASVTCPPSGSTSSVLVTVSDGGQACYNYTVGLENTQSPTSTCATACTLAFSNPSNAIFTLTTGANITDLLPSLPHPSGNGTACSGRPVADGVVVGTSAGTCATNYTVEYNVSSVTPACNATLLQTVVLNTDQVPLFNASTSTASFDCAVTTFASQQLATVSSPTGVTASQDGADGPRTTLRCANNYQFERNFTATYCGNTATFTQTVTVDDTTKPVLTPVTDPAPAQCASLIGAEPTVTASDNCDTSVAAVLSNTTTPGSCANRFTLMRTWTATDGCGNSANVSQTVAVYDDAAPTFDTTGLVNSVACGDSTDPDATGTPRATDNCDGNITPTYGDGPVTLGSGGCGRTFTRTWTAKDACGNTATYNQTITVSDTAAPTLLGTAAAQDASYTCASAVGPAPTLTASDTCDGSIVPDFANTTKLGGCANRFTLVRTWNATDDCGNTATFTQTVTVNDTTKPVLTPVTDPAPAQCASLIGAEPTVTASDNCDTSVAAVLSNTTTPGSCANRFTLMRTWTATDGCGNSANVSQTVAVYDDAAPTFDTTGLVNSVACGDSTDPDATGTPRATDNCDGNITPTYGDGPVTLGSGGCGRTFTRTWTAKDACGNTATYNQTITVSDTAAPTLLGTAAAQDASYTCASAVGPAPTLTASDTCDGSIVPDFANTTKLGGCANRFTLVRTWNATDDCGNTATFTQTVTVNDTTKPVLTPVTDPAPAQCASLIGAEPTVTASDNCDTSVAAVLSNTTTPGSCANRFTLVRTWTATDGCGNSANVSQTVAVYDDAAPTFTKTPADDTVECGSSVAPSDTNGPATATDNCGGAVNVTYSDAVTLGSGGCGSTITRTWTATDACGNAATYNQTITVNDTTKPVLTPVTDPAPAQCASLIGAEPTVTASDNCDTSVAAVLSNTTTPGTCANRFTLVRTWTATDKCGNSDSVSQTVSVNDDTAPQLTPPNRMVPLCIGGAAPRATCSDNCGNCTVIPTRTASTTYQNGAGTETWTYQATDGCQTTPVTAATTSLVKYCSCGNTGFAGPSQWQYPTLSDTSAGIKGGPWYAIDRTRWGWGVALTSAAPRVVASFWTGAAQNARSKGVNGGNITIARSGQDITVTFSLFAGSEAPVGDMHIAAQCAQVLSTAFGNSPFLQSPRDSGLVVTSAPGGGIYSLKLPSDCPTGFVVVHNGAGKTCPP